MKRAAIHDHGFVQAMKPSLFLQMSPVLNFESCFSVTGKPFLVKKLISRHIRVSALHVDGQYLIIVKGTEFMAPIFIGRSGSAEYWPPTPDRVSNAAERTAGEMLQTKSVFNIAALWMPVNRLLPRRQRAARLLAVLAGLAGLIHAGGLHAYTTSEANNITVYGAVAASVVNITTEICEPESFFCTVPTEPDSASGIVLREDGTIVTNHHVVANAGSIQVTSADGRRFKASVVASSAVEDVAVLHIDVGDRPLKAIRMGDSDSLQVGEKVLAIGNPFGLGQSLSVGTVSMLNRSVRKDGVVLRELIQTDAAINPGSSGGAMVNSRGELVGMNTLILSPTGSSIRIGFAIR